METHKAVFVFVEKCPLKQSLVKSPYQRYLSQVRVHYETRYWCHFWAISGTLICTVGTFGDINTCALYVQHAPSPPPPQCSRTSTFVSFLSPLPPRLATRPFSSLQFRLSLSLQTGSLSPPNLCALFPLRTNPLLSMLTLFLGS